MRKAVLSLVREPDPPQLHLIINRTEDRQIAEIRGLLRRGEFDLPFLQAVVVSAWTYEIAESPAPFRPRCSTDLRQRKRRDIADRIAARVIRPVGPRRADPILRSELQLATACQRHGPERGQWISTW